MLKSVSMLMKEARSEDTRGKYTLSASRLYPFSGVAETEANQTTALPLESPPATDAVSIPLLSAKRSTPSRKLLLAKLTQPPTSACLHAGRYSRAFALLPHCSFPYPSMPVGSVWSIYTCARAYMLARKYACARGDGGTQGRRNAWVCTQTWHVHTYSHCPCASGGPGTLACKHSVSWQPSPHLRHAAMTKTGAILGTQRKVASTGLGITAPKYSMDMIHLPSS